MNGDVQPVSGLFGLPTPAATPTTASTTSPATAALATAASTAFSLTAGAPGHTLVLLGNNS